MYSICGQHAVSFFVNSSAQHRENEAEPDSNENKISKARFKSGPNVPCQSAQTDKSVSSVIHVHVYVHNIIFLWKCGHCQLCSMLMCQNDMLEVFPCLSCVDRKKRKNRPYRI